MNKTNIILTIVLLVFLIIVIILTNLSKKENIDGSNYDFKIYFFNAGKADAIVISNNNKYIMIDTGEESLSPEILSYFKNNNINELEYLIITHFDKDHVGSAASIINNIKVNNVFQSNYPKDSEYYSNYLNALSNKNIIPKTIEGNYEFTLEDLNIVVNGPVKIYDKNESNNSSLIVKINYKNTNHLFMGDAENARLKDYVSEETNTYDFIKIPYHGNYLKRLDDLLEIIKPKYAVITSSNSMRESSETINTLSELGIKYYLTRNGDINIYSDGTNIIVDD